MPEFNIQNKLGSEPGPKQGSTIASGFDLSPKALASYGLAEYDGELALRYLTETAVALTNGGFVEEPDIVPMAQHINASNKEGIEEVLRNNGYVQEDVSKFFVKKDGTEIKSTTRVWQKPSPDGQTLRFILEGAGENLTTEFLIVSRADLPIIKKEFFLR